MTMIDLTAIILTKDEALHMRRCLERLQPFCRRIYVVDCGSTDETLSICAEFSKVRTAHHDWPGNQALQFNWALENLDIESEWIIRLDADEYLMPGEGERLQNLLSRISPEVSGVQLLLERFFMGRLMKHGGTRHIPMVRVFRTGCAKCEVRDMDEHIILEKGELHISDIAFADDSRIPFARWVQKHLNYAAREAGMLLAGEGCAPGVGAQALQSKRKQKAWYGRLPLFWRAFAYFAYRYIVRLGFLDGKEGFLWHFMQAWWYRTTVDIMVMEGRSNRRRGQESH